MNQSSLSSFPLYYIHRAFKRLERGDGLKATNDQAAPFDPSTLPGWTPLEVVTPPPPKCLPESANTPVKIQAILDGTVLSMITTVTGKNQITIPAELARELDISPGTKLDWNKGEAGVLVVKIIPNRAELARRLAGRGRRHLREGSVPIQDLVEDRAHEDLQEGLQ